MLSSRTFENGRIFVLAVAWVALAIAASGAEAAVSADVKQEYIAAGIYQTGLTPDMPKDAACPTMTLGFASRVNRSGRLRTKRHGLYHAGVDWAFPVGTPIVAIADGRVIARRIDLDKGPGYHLIIRHYPWEDHLSSSYVHLSRFNVELDQEVKRGQVIGFTGQTGTGATFPHLHLNIYGKARMRVGNRYWRYRYDYLQFLSGDMMRIDPSRKRKAKVKVAYMDRVGKVHPPNAKVIWPFVCRRNAP